jgi:single-strand DNA-binding protein
MFNKIILVGNLTKDIDLRYAQSGSAIANTSIATSRKFTANGEKKEEICFVDITFFGRSGEVANQYLRKGSKILIEGRLSFEQWIDKTSGQKRSKHSVIVETMQMLDSKPTGEQQEQKPYQAPQPEYTKHTDYKPAPRQEMPDNTLSEIDINEDEIPF